MKKLIILITCLLISSNLYAQNDPKKTQAQKDREELEKAIKEMQESMQKQFEREHKEMEKMLGGGLLKRFNQMFGDMQNDNAFDQMKKALEQMGDDNFFQGFGDLGGLGGLKNEDYEWLENESERSLVLKVKVVKDAPFDIKVKDDKIRIAGTYEKTLIYEDPRSGAKSESIRRASFVRSFQVPIDTDATKVRIEQIKENIHIILPKKSALKGKSLKPKKDPSLKPVKPKKGDVTI